MTAQRSSASADWGTPADIIEAVRACLGGTIAFDPCTSEEHQQVVRADVTCTRGGLEGNWSQFDNVFCNPPGSARGVQDWWEKFSREVDCGIWLGFNMNQLAYLEPNPLKAADWIFIPRHRLKFRGAGNNPPHNSYLVGVGCPGYTLIESIEGTYVRL